MRLVPRTLTWRLVMTAVALVAAVSVLLAAVTTLAMREYLNARLDAQVLGIAQRGGEVPGLAPRARPGEEHSRDGHDADDFGPGPRGFGTLVADLTRRKGGIVNESGNPTGLTVKDFDQLNQVPRDGAAHTVRLNRGADYRVIVATSANTGNPVAFGVPTDEVDRSIAWLLALSSVLVLFGVGLAAVAGTALVRRQLKPLRAVAGTAHDVSTLPLDSGDQSTQVRVPTEFTDPGNEVGQVGSALNTLLDHVDAALAARHRSEQQVRQFVADASHELRTPLSTIHGYAELSRRTPDDAAALSTAMTKVETEADRMSALVEDLLLLARLDSGRPLERATVDLTRLLLEALTDARVVAPEHRWRLDLPDQPITVIGDEQRLHQVITNLTSNARRHTPAGTTVTVGATTTPEAVLIRVHDDGPGISPELQPVIFERFTRGDSSRTRASGGAGLGLSLVKAIVGAHGGRIEVRSAPGDTTFTVMLPPQAPS